jgi:CBS domain-containing protein
MHLIPKENSCSDFINCSRFINHVVVYLHQILYTVYIEQKPQTFGALRHGEMRQTVNIAYFLHPKGQVAFLYDDYTFRQGLEKMKHHGYTAIPVISRSGQYVGTVSEGDFLWQLVQEENEGSVTMKELEQLQVRDILQTSTYPPVRITVTMDELLDSAMQQNFIPVVDDSGSFIGIVTRKDIIRYFAKEQSK